MGRMGRITDATRANMRLLFALFSEDDISKLVGSFAMVVVTNNSVGKVSSALFYEHRQTCLTKLNNFIDSREACITARPQTSKLERLFSDFAYFWGNISSTVDLMRSYALDEKAVPTYAGQCKKCKEAVDLK